MASTDVPFRLAASAAEIRGPLIDSATLAAELDASPPLVLDIRVYKLP